jgi:hypothetical protein
MPALCGTSVTSKELSVSVRLSWITPSAFVMLMHEPLILPFRLRFSARGKQKCCRHDQNELGFEGLCGERSIRIHFDNFMTAILKSRCDDGIEKRSGWRRVAILDDADGE